MDKHDFASEVEDLGNFLQELEKVHRRELSACDEAEHRATVDEERLMLLEEKQHHQAVEEIKASRDFSVATERLLSDKILKLYEDLSTQIQVVDV